MPLPLIPIIIGVGVSVGTYIAGGVALAGTALAAKYGWDWYSDNAHVDGLVKAFHKNGEAGFRSYAYSNLGISGKDEMDALWACEGPDIAAEAVKQQIKKAAARQYSAQAAASFTEE